MANCTIGYWNVRLRSSGAGQQFAELYVEGYQEENLSLGGYPSSYGGTAPAGLIANGLQAGGPYVYKVTSNAPYWNLEQTVTWSTTPVGIQGSRLTSLPECTGGTPPATGGCNCTAEIATSEANLQAQIDDLATQIMAIAIPTPDLSAIETRLASLENEEIVVNLDLTSILRRALGL